MYMATGAPFTGAMLAHLKTFLLSCGLEYDESIAFSAAREPSEFRAELADLDAQLELLAETERLSLQNIL